MLNKKFKMKLCCIVIKKHGSFFAINLETCYESHFLLGWWYFIAHGTF